MSTPRIGIGTLLDAKPLSGHLNGIIDGVVRVEGLGRDWLIAREVYYENGKWNDLDREPLVYRYSPQTLADAVLTPGQLAQEIEL